MSDAADSTQTVRTLLLSSSPGQFDPILNDLRCIIPKSSPDPLDDEFIAGVRSEWEGATRSSILSEKNDEAARHRDSCVSFLRDAMDEYLKRKIALTNTRAAYEIIETVDRKIVITVYSEKNDFHNFRAGSLTGTYTFCNSTGSFNGSVNIHTHTFENEANFQLKSKIEMNPIQVGTCSTSDGNEKQSSWADAIIQQIITWEETEVAPKIRDMYNSIGTTLKTLRRVMPVTRTKMNWNAMPHRVVQTLEQGLDREKTEE
eukprot:CCRYP_021059-RA/>CCRYP_021059-RA protein AED:0.02 eAED:0.02 QI:34/1/1/1/0/0/2/400/258